MSLNNDELTREQVIRAASASKKKTVRDAYNKLKFAVELAHTKEEMEELAETTIYQMRISFQFEDGPETYSISMRWCDDEFVLYAPSQGGPIAGYGNTMEEEPTVIYFNKPLKSTDNLMQDLKDAAKAMYGKVGKRK